MDNKTQVQLIQEAIDYCQTIYLDGMIVVPLMLSNDESELSLMDRGIRKSVLVSNHNFEGED